MYLQTEELKGKEHLSRENLWPSARLGQSAAGNKFKECWGQQKNALESVFQAAQRSVNHATAVLGSAHGRPDGMTQATRNLLNKHFHTNDRSDLFKIFTNLFRIQRAFQAGITFECEMRCAGGTTRTCGYAYATQWFGGHGPVHICFDNRPGHCGFAGLSALEQRALIIHEVAHRYVGIEDKAYEWEDGIRSKRDYRKLTPKQAIDNADSYAWFCVEL